MFSGKAYHGTVFVLKSPSSSPQGMWVYSTCCAENLRKKQQETGRMYKLGGEGKGQYKTSSSVGRDGASAEAAASQAL